MENWLNFLKHSNIPEDEAQTYAETFVKNRIMDPTDLTKEILIDLGITVIGDRIAILKHAELISQDCKPQSAIQEDKSAILRYHKPINAKLPELKSDSTHQEYRKFKIDWQVYKDMTNLPRDQIASHLYTAYDSNVQNCIINSSEDFFTMSEEAMLRALESMVTKKSNPAVHRVTFATQMQSENESIKDFVVRLKSVAKDCEFSCPQ